MQSSGPSALLDRLIFLSDGVFAIAMTLLIFGLTVPDVAPEALAAELVALWPKYLTYAISFVVVALYWSAHQRTFGYIVRADGVLIGLNVLLLLLIGFQPFLTNVLRTYSGPGLTAAVTFYAATLTLTGIVLLAIWLYATSAHRLVSPSLGQRAIRYGTWRTAIVPTVFLLSIPIALINGTVAELTWILIFPVTLFLRRLFARAP